MNDLRDALEVIVIRCKEGDKKFNWLPTIADIAERALASQPSPAATVETKSAPPHSASQLAERAPSSDAAPGGADTQCSAGNEQVAREASDLADKIEHALRIEGKVTLHQTDGTRALYAVRKLFADEPQAAPKLSDFAELKLLIDEYDPENSDWNFRRGVLLDILVRIWPTSLATVKP